MSLLQIRLKNCLQTLLDLQPNINENHPVFFENDFILLEKCLARVDKMDLMEEEVRALENYTADFLTELGQGGGWDKICRLLQ